MALWLVGVISSHRLLSLYSTAVSGNTVLCLFPYDPGPSVIKAYYLLSRLLSASSLLSLYYLLY